jgi:hypothetical protein
MAREGVGDVKRDPPSPSSLRTRLRLAKGFGVAGEGLTSQVTVCSSSFRALRLGQLSGRASCRDKPRFRKSTSIPLLPRS